MSRKNLTFKELTQLYFKQIPRCQKTICKFNPIFQRYVSKTQIPINPSIFHPYPRKIPFITQKKSKTNLETNLPNIQIIIPISLKQVEIFKIPNPNIPITHKNKQVPLISCVQCTYTICTHYIYVFLDKLNVTTRLLAVDMFKIIHKVWIYTSLLQTTTTIECNNKIIRCLYIIQNHTQSMDLCTFKLQTPTISKYSQQLQVPILSTTTPRIQTNFTLKHTLHNYLHELFSSSLYCLLLLNLLVNFGCSVFLGAK